MVKYAVITSKKDIAGCNIRTELEKLGIQTHHFDKDIVNLEHVDREKGLSEADVIIFASRHYSSAGKKNFCVHTVGNFKEAKFGGQEETLTPTSSQMFKKMCIVANKNVERAKNERKIHADYEFSMECTHHGPLIEKPCIFVEVGGTEEEWKDLQAVRVLAESIKEFLDSPAIDSTTSAIAVGGLHYCQSFNRIQLETDYAISFIAPKHALPLNKDLINQAIQKTMEKPTIAIIDYKGLGNAAQRDKTIEMLKECGLEIIKTSDID
jgi:D-aminoacyl-tRNA deacylase